jgi:hypothetical protein
VRPDTQAVLDGGPPIAVPEITDEMLAASISDPEELRLVRSVGMRSAIVLTPARRRAHHGPADDDQRRERPLVQL